MTSSKGGGARRGPFSGKKATFATRLTDDTMGHLVRMSQREGLSLSQMAEALLIDAIRRADEISAIFEEDYRHFETSMKDSIPIDPVEPEVLSDWERTALDQCGLLHDSWCRKIKDYAASKLGAHKGPLSQPTIDAAQKPTLPPTYPRKPGVRALDLD